MYCIRCGSYLQEGAVCDKCLALAANDAPQQSQPEYQQLEQQPQVESHQSYQPYQPYQPPQPVLHQTQEPYSSPEIQSQFQQFQEQFSQSDFQQPQPTDYPQPQNLQTGYPAQTQHQPVPQQQQQQPPSGYQPYNQYSQPSYQQQYQQPQPGYQQFAPGYQTQPSAYPADFGQASGKFAQIMQKVGGSPSFLIGIILFTLGSLGGIVVSFNVIGVVQLILIALPIIGFWLIYFASKSSPISSAKALPAITMFKVSVTISFVFECFIVLCLIIVTVFMFIGASFMGLDMNTRSETAIINIFAVVLLTAAAIVLTLSIIYFRSQLHVLNGIKGGLLGDQVSKLRGAGFLIVYTFIVMGFSFLSNITSMMAFSTISGDITSTLYPALNELPYELRDIIEPYLLGFGQNLALASIFACAASIGTIICVVSLNRFNNLLKYSPNNMNY